MQPQFDNQLFGQVPIIGILRGMATADLPYILESYLQAGLTTIEITMNTPQVEEQIAMAVNRYGDRLNIGAGTVRNLEEWKRAIGAGASFIVSPNVDKDVITSSKSKGIAVFPGALTPTEVYQAWQYGADKIKVFPASALGSSYIKNLKGPFDHIQLIATGGIDVHNLSEYWNAGADGFGIGGSLFDKKMIRKRNWDGLEKHMHRFVQVIQKGKE